MPRRSHRTLNIPPEFNGLPDRRRRRAAPPPVQAPAQAPYQPVIPPPRQQGARSHRPVDDQPYTTPVVTHRRRKPRAR